jgi:catechol 2,3-dioxygenase-like lactoylglutathione lyase family enzyme
MRQGAISPFISVPDTIGELLAVGASVPLDAGGRVHVVGRNDMLTPQEMGCTWVVTDPDGVVVEDHTDDWAGWPWPTDVDPNATHEFISRSRFDLNKAGTWAIAVNLLMGSPDNPVVVDTYEGVLCVVEEAVLIEGTIIRKELEYSGSGDGIVPVANVPQGVSAKLHVWGRNDMAISQGMGIYWFVADPNGIVVEIYEDWGGTIGAGQDHEFISSGQFDLNRVGKYTTWIELQMGSQDNPVIVDRYIGDLCTVGALEYKGTIITKELEYDSVRGDIPVY